LFEQNDGKTQARRQDFAAGGPKTTRGCYIVNYNIGCML